MKRPSSDNSRSQPNIRQIQKNKSLTDFTNITYNLPKYDNIEWSDTSQSNIEEKVNWPRAPSKTIDPNKKLRFQKLDIHYEIRKPNTGSAIGNDIANRNNLSEIPVIIMHGNTWSGSTVVCRVFGYFPYFYVELPKRIVTQAESLKRKFWEALNNKLNDNSKTYNARYVLDVSVVNKLPIMGYTGATEVFFKIVLKSPKEVPKARSILEKESLSVDGIGSNIIFRTYEAGLAFVLRFMVDTGIKGVSWVEIKEGEYDLISPQNKISSADIEIEVEYKAVGNHCMNIIALSDELDKKWLRIAPLRILSFDIECASLKGFPKPEKDPVIQIANVVTIFGQQKPIIKNIFVLGKCCSILDVDVRCYRTEKKLLKAWREFIQTVDPDIITGYNIINFDIPYIFKRATELNIKDFSKMTRLLDNKVKMKKENFQSVQRGNRDFYVINMYGRVFFDLMQVVIVDYKLRSYSLNSVASEFLKEQKEDVHYSIITTLHTGTPDDRKRLASYCSKDAVLPLRLLDKLMCVINYIEMSRVTGVPFSFLLTKGQTLKVLTQLYRKTYDEGIIIPTAGDEDIPPYEGATVYQPKVAFYNTPIVTLDFVSLYPSIMIEHNLCYTTLIKPNEVKNFKSDDVTRTPFNAYFIKPHIRKGVLPSILENLLEARKKVKLEMAQESDPFKKMVLNGRQNALKVSCNSVYGFTGFKGKLPCIEISASVTSYGRKMLDTTIECIQTEYKNADVIYGDTDSVMIKFKFEGDEKTLLKPLSDPDNLTIVSQSIILGKEICKNVTSKFKGNIIKLDFEKVYFPYLLIAKKRYAGVLWLGDKKFEKIDAKGIETVRRDNCGLVRHTIDICLRKILIEKDVDGALNFAGNIIRDLLCNRIDMSLLVITKSLSKDEDEYSVPQAHSVLVKKMKLRDASTAPAKGDRVPYVIIQGMDSLPIYEKAEDPIYALNEGLTIDSNYYLQKQLLNPLTKLFTPLLGKDPTDFFLHGKHTSQITRNGFRKSSIAEMFQATVIRKCLACQGVLKDTNKEPLCEECMYNAPEIYQKFLVRARIKQREFNRLWTQCQDCQGSMINEVLCTARDCPIFYMRTQVKQDLETATGTLKQFDW